MLTAYRHKRPYFSPLPSHASLLTAVHVFIQHKFLRMFPHASVCAELRSIQGERRTVPSCQFSLRTAVHVFIQHKFLRMFPHASVCAELRSIQGERRTVPSCQFSGLLGARSHAAFKLPFGALLELPRNPAAVSHSRGSVCQVNTSFGVFRCLRQLLRD